MTYYRYEPSSVTPLLYISHGVVPLGMSVEMLNGPHDCLDFLRPLLCGYIIGREAQLTQTQSGLFQVIKAELQSLGSPAGEENLTG